MQDQTCGWGPGSRYRGKSYVGGTTWVRGKWKGSGHWVRSENTVWEIQRSWVGLDTQGPALKQWAEDVPSLSASDWTLSMKIGDRDSRVISNA